MPGHREIGFRTIKHDIEEKLLVRFKRANNMILLGQRNQNILDGVIELQRIGDLVWAAADMAAKGFLVGGTAGRTTLAGEGLQHQDGNSHLLAYPVPNLVTYDPAFAYELAVIIRDGIRRMYEEQEKVFYYIKKY